MSRSSVDDTLEIRKKEIDAMYQIGTILDTGLDKRTIAILLELIECGVHPEALADGESINISAPMHFVSTTI